MIVRPTQVKGRGNSTRWEGRNCKQANDMNAGSGRRRLVVWRGEVLLLRFLDRRPFYDPLKYEKVSVNSSPRLEMYFCAISGEPPQEPVISPKSGQLYERRLILKYIAENGTDPTTGDKLDESDLITLKARE